MKVQNRKFYVQIFSLILSVIGLTLGSSAYGIEGGAVLSLEEAGIPVAITMVAENDNCQNAGERQIYFCTGTRVSKTEIVTAGHCVSKVHNEKKHGAIYVWQNYDQIYDYLKSDFEGKCRKPYEFILPQVALGNAFKVRKILPAAEESSQANDAVILKVNDSRLNHTIVPMRFGEALEEGRELEVIGLGPTVCWDGHTDLGGSMSTADARIAKFKIAPRHYATELRSQYPNLSFLTNAQNRVQILERSVLPSESVAQDGGKFCHGDSGSGVFIRDEQGLQIVSVLSKMGDENISGHQEPIHLALALSIDSPFLSGQFEWENAKAKLQGLKNIDLKSVGSNLKDQISKSLELLSYSMTSKADVETFKQRLADGSLRIKEITDEDKNSMQIKSIVAIFRPDSIDNNRSYMKGEILINPNVQLGIFSMIFYHEMIHAIDDQYYMELVKSRIIVESVFNESKNTKKEKFWSPLVKWWKSSVVGQEDDKIEIASQMAAQIKDGASFVSERNAYDGAYGLASEWASVFPNGEEYFNSAAQTIGMNFLTPVSSAGIINGYSFDAEKVENYLNQNNSHELLLR